MVEWGGNKVLIRHVAIMGFLNQMQRRGRDAAEVAAAVNHQGTRTYYKERWTVNERHLSDSVGLL